MGRHPKVTEITPVERKVLQGLARDHSRAQAIMILSAPGQSELQVAESVGVSRPTLRKWRSEFERARGDRVAALMALPTNRSVLSEAQRECAKRAVRKVLDEAGASDSRIRPSLMKALRGALGADGQGLKAGYCYALIREVVSEVRQQSGPHSEALYPSRLLLPALHRRKDDVSLAGQCCPSANPVEVGLFRLGSLVASRAERRAEFLRLWGDSRQGYGDMARCARVAGVSISSAKRYLASELLTKGSQRRGKPYVDPEKKARIFRHAAHSESLSGCYDYVMLIKLDLACSSIRVPVAICFRKDMSVRILCSNADPSGGAGEFSQFIGELHSRGLRGVRLFVMRSEESPAKSLFSRAKREDSLGVPLSQSSSETAEDRVQELRERCGFSVKALRHQSRGRTEGVENAIRKYPGAKLWRVGAQIPSLDKVFPKYRGPWVRRAQRSGANFASSRDCDAVYREEAERLHWLFQRWFDDGDDYLRLRRKEVFTLLEKSHGQTKLIEPPECPVPYLLPQWRTRFARLLLDLESRSPSEIEKICACMEADLDAQIDAPSSIFIHRIRPPAEDGLACRWRSQISRGREIGKVPAGVSKERRAENLRRKRYRAYLKKCKASLRRHLDDFVRESPFETEGLPDVFGRNLLSMSLERVLQAAWGLYDENPTLGELLRFLKSVERCLNSARGKKLFAMA